MSSGSLIQEITPANGRSELRGVALLTLSIALAWAGGLVLRRSDPLPPRLAPHQLSAFAALDARDQGLFNDLRTAADEIRSLHAQASAWPEPQALAAEAIPPFARDAVWSQRGGLVWERLDAHSPSHAVYWGRSDAIEWALILIGDKTTIWRRVPRKDGSFPQAIPPLLVIDGWSEFVARSSLSP